MTNLSYAPHVLRRWKAIRESGDLNSVSSLRLAELTGISTGKTLMGVLEHLGIAQAPAWLFAAELENDS